MGLMEKSSSLIALHGLGRSRCMVLAGPGSRPRHHGVSFRGGVTGTADSSFAYQAGSKMQEHRAVVDSSQRTRCEMPSNFRVLRSKRRATLREKTQKRKNMHEESEGA
eukprot:6210217-Pleurochrysis_carterae.AAC.3